MQAQAAVLPFSGSLEVPQSFSNGASNPVAKLALLELRLTGQDTVNAKQVVGGSSSCFGAAPFAHPLNPPRSQLDAKGSTPPFEATAVEPAAAMVGSMAPGTYAPRQPLTDLQLQAAVPIQACSHPIFQTCAPVAAQGTAPLQQQENNHQHQHPLQAAAAAIHSARKGRKDSNPQKRKRNSSPLDQTLPNKLRSPGGDGLVTPGTQTAGPANAAVNRALFSHGTSTAQAPGVAATPASGGRARASKAVANKPVGGQTKLNAYFPVLDGSSRDSEASGHSNGNAVGNGQHGSTYQDSHQHATSAANARLPAALCSPQQPCPLQTAEDASKPQQTAAGVSNLMRAHPSPTQSRAVTGPAAQHTGLVGQLSPIPEGAALEYGSTAALAAQQQVNVHAIVTQATAHLQEQLVARERQLEQLRQQHRQAVGAAESKVADLTAELASSSARATNLLSDLDRLRQIHEEREAKFRSELTKAMFGSAKDRRELARLQLTAASVQLGNIGVHRAGLTLQEVWEDGQAGQALASKQAAIAAQREEVEAARKSLRKKLAPPPRMAAASSNAGALVPGSSAADNGYMDGLEFVTQDEIYKTRLAGLKREEDSLKEEHDRLAAEKAKHVRAIKRLRDEEGSRFGCGSTVLGTRFVLLSMLGKGGFSEVFKAYDLRDLRVVAAKVHQLNPGWSEARKASYVKHAIREVDIQKAMRHPHIVSLLEIVEVDAHCFATVLEYCEGGDLDTLLRDHSTLPEKEARSILCQVLAGLAYLNQPGRRIIHYDLKPANILFDGLGAAKITDFGLSKVVEDGATQGLELTSQGAGTYWYLPPECFEVGGAHAPRITNKVDVWSVGVIFYQMLYGKRPYGEGLSQEQIMRDRVVLGAREVEFPSKPAVSAEAKEFIRRCLALRAELRWDVATAAADPYINRR